MVLRPNQSRAEVGRDERRMSMSEAYCNWCQKELRDIAEHEQEQCDKNKQKCDDCPNLEYKGNDNSEV